jgi:hypothetical protein
MDKFEKLISTCNIYLKQFDNSLIIIIIIIIIIIVIYFTNSTSETNT